jgi:hypothetical protein
MYTRISFEGVEPHTKVVQVKEREKPSRHGILPLAGNEAISSMPSQVGASPTLPLKTSRWNPYGASVVVLALMEKIPSAARAVVTKKAFATRSFEKCILN